MPRDLKGRTEPGYLRHVFICGHTRDSDNKRGCCSSKGSIEVMRSMKHATKAAGLSDVRVQKSGCLDFCENGISCVVYPEGVWYSIADANDGAKIISEHLAAGNIVDELLMKLVDEDE
ncbi:MAG: hypothetical protein QGH90_06775 [Candidatus Poseidoniaceae archaeon]|nr:hypothetical protein [Candidatus Poseidoniaceae archaeon]MDP7001590.1 hypothetical protein [Candidatus Poseidoniaceae archaeon]